MTKRQLWQAAADRAEAQAALDRADDDEHHARLLRLLEWARSHQQD